MHFFVFIDQSNSKPIFLWHSFSSLAIASGYTMAIYRSFSLHSHARTHKRRLLPGFRMTFQIQVELLPFPYVLCPCIILGNLAELAGGSRGPHSVRRLLARHAIPCVQEVRHPSSATSLHVALRVWPAYLLPFEYDHLTCRPLSTTNLPVALRA